jgi:DNA polymerase
LALAGKALPINRNRGEADFNGRRGFITIHPSYLLRLQDKASKSKGYSDFVADLELVRTLASTRRKRVSTGQAS